MVNIVLGLSAAAQAADPPATLLQPHGTAQVDSIAQNGLGASDSSDSESSRSNSSLKLTRGPSGEAFVTSEGENVAEAAQSAQKELISQVGGTRAGSGSVEQPRLRPEISPYVTPGSVGPALGQPAGAVSGSNADVSAPDEDSVAVPGAIPAAEAGAAGEVVSSPLKKTSANARDHGDEFPADIDNISPSTITEDQMPEPASVQATIQYDEKSPAENILLKGNVSIFQVLDEALARSPRSAAIRSLLPVSRAELARATEQTSPAYVYDNGVRAEQTRRTGVVLSPEPPWKLIFRLLAAKRLVEQAKQDLLSQLWSLRAEVRLAYAEVVVAQETLETLNSLYDLAHRLMVVSEKRFQAGDVPELDMLKARLAESQYDVERRVGLRRVVRAKQQLNVIMGRKAEMPLSVPRLPPFLKTSDMAKAAEAKNLLLPDFDRQINPLQHYIDISMKHRYELKSLDRQIALNKAQLRNAYGNIPGTPQFWIGSSQAGNPPTGPQLNAYYFGISIPSNLTEFQQGDIAKFKAVARQLKYQTGALKNVITAEVSSAYNNVLAARQKLRIYQEHVLADSYEVARLARRSYEVGQSDITSTIQAQQNNVQIRTQYLEAIQLYQQAFTELERACGTPLLESDE